MFYFDTSTVVLLDESGENGVENKIKNANALKPVRDMEKVVAHINTKGQTPRVLITGRVLNTGFIAEMEVTPMDGFDDEILREYDRAMFPPR